MDYTKTIIDMLSKNITISEKINYKIVDNRIESNEITIDGKQYTMDLSLKL